jgi:hypothetical protein
MAERYEDLLIAGLDDWLHIADVTYHLGLPRDRKDAACQAEAAIRDLVEKGLVLVGDVTGDRFVAWDGSAGAIGRRVLTAWEALDHDPVPGDVCWLANTAEGDRLAREGLAERGEPPG